MNGPGRFTIYYDGGCPVCDREIAFYRRRVGAGELRFADISRVHGANVAPDLRRDAAMAELHVRDERGELVAGVDAFIALWRRLPGLRWMAVLGTLPGLRQLLGMGYAGFLRWRERDLERRCEGGVCKVPSATRGE